MIEFIAGADCGANAADPFAKGDAGCNLGTKCMTKDKSAASATGDNADDKCACNKAEFFVEDANLFWFEQSLTKSTTFSIQNDFLSTFMNFYNEK